MADVQVNGIQFAIKGSTASASQAIDELRKKLSSLTSALGNTGSIKTASSRFNLLGSSIRLVTTPLRQVTSGLKSFASGLKSTFSGMARIAKYRLFRTVIKEITEAFAEGTKNAYFYTKQIGTTTKYISEAFDEFASSTAQMKNQIGAAWATLFAQIQPVISQIIEWVSRAVEVVTMFFAEISGKNTYLKALKYTTAWAEETESGAQSAKKWRAALMGFDELNRLNEKTGSSSSGSSGTDYSAMFAEVPIETAVAGLAEQVKALWQSQDWQGLGTLIGGKVNELIDGVNWEGLGTKVGQWINALFTTKYWIIDTINFTTLGENIATFLNNAFEEINWYTLGSYLAQKIGSMLELCVSIVMHIKWFEIGNGLGELVSGWFDELTRKIVGINWFDLGTSLANGLADMFEGVDNSGAVSSISSFVGAALGAAFSTISGFIQNFANMFWNYLKLKLSADPNDDDILSLTEILGNIINFEVDVAGWIETKITDPFYKSLAKAFGNDDFETEGKQSYLDLVFAAYDFSTDPAGYIADKIKEATGQTSALDWNFHDWLLDALLGGEGFDTSLEQWALEIAEWFVNDFPLLITAAKASVKQFGIDIANSMLEPINGLLDSVVDMLNGDNWYAHIIRKAFGLDDEIEIPYIHIKLFSDLEPSPDELWEQYRQGVEDKSMIQPAKVNAVAEVSDLSTEAMLEEKKKLRGITVEVSDAVPQSGASLSVPNVTANVTNMDTSGLGAAKKKIPNTKASVTSVDFDGLEAQYRRVQACEALVSKFTDKIPNKNKTVTGFTSQMVQAAYSDTFDHQVPRMLADITGYTDNLEDRTIKNMAAVIKSKTVPTTTAFRTITDMKAGITKKDVSGMNKTVGGMKASFSAKSTSDLDKTVTGMKASFSAKSTANMDKTVTGMTAGIEKTSTANLSSTYKTIGVTAKFTSTDMGSLTGSNKPKVDAKAALNEAFDNIGVSNKPKVQATASLTDGVDNISAYNKPSIKVSGLVSSATVAAGVTVSIPATAYVTGTVDTTPGVDPSIPTDQLYEVKTCPDCGSTNGPTRTKCGKCGFNLNYVNTGYATSPPTYYASGGCPECGELYWARENGISELVGRVGGRHAVMNNDQIVQSVSNGIARTLDGMRFAVSGGGSVSAADSMSNEDAMYRAFKRALDETDFGGDIDLDGEKLYRALVRRNVRNTRMTGVNAMAMA